ncbi:hypothetical protein Tsp_10273 [Trichinella spiralis]|uniref:hypothetical protein n=1 Tax=Trichinella spiralis TaxID=6334 RepID=UPI0001EFE1B0|nr:hypothetical protein Tsp_10273 [Trichinella spiralis]
MYILLQRSLGRIFRQQWSVGIGEQFQLQAVCNDGRPPKGQRTSTVLVFQLPGCLRHRFAGQLVYADTKLGLFIGRLFCILFLILILIILIQFNFLHGYLESVYMS